MLRSRTAILTLAALIAGGLPLTTVMADQPATAADATETGFVSIFDGESLDGWKINEENADSWSVEDGMIKVAGERSHMYHEGEFADVKDFHLKADVKVMPKGNSGIFFHTKYQSIGWPSFGHECQVNVSHYDPKKTSSLYDVVNVDAETLQEHGIEAGQWYQQEIIVEGKRVRLIVNGDTLVDYTEPDGDAREGAAEHPDRKISQGTFALQAHDPGSVAYFKNIRVKALN